MIFTRGKRKHQMDELMDTRTTATDTSNNVMDIVNVFGVKLAVSRRRYHCDFRIWDGLLFLCSLLPLKSHSPSFPIDFID